MNDNKVVKQKNIGEQMVLLLEILSIVLAGAYFLFANHRYQIAMILLGVGVITYVLSMLFPEDVKCYIGNAEFLPPCMIVFLVTGLILGITFFFKMSSGMYFLYAVIFAVILFLPLAIRNYSHIHGEIWSIFIAIFFFGFGVAGFVNGTIGVKEVEVRQETVTDKNMSSKGYYSIYTESKRYSASKSLWSSASIGDTIEVTEYVGILNMKWCQIK